jgi:mono/diheme cytochrome c family protein
LDSVDALTARETEAALLTGGLGAAHQRAGCRARAIGTCLAKEANMRLPLLRFRTLSILTLSSASALAGWSCSRSDAAPSGVSAQAQAQAATLYNERCAKCHGVRGKGDGPLAHTLKPRPRDFTDATWHLAVSDRVLDKIIQQGGAAVGKSAAMPANPDLGDKPELVIALRQHLRMLAGSE